LIKALFQDEIENDKRVNYLDTLRAHSLPCRMAQVYRNACLLFEFVSTDVRYQIKPVD
jgi:hypothetical protein